MLRSIGMNSLSNTAIRSIFFPKTLERLEDGWFVDSLDLNEVIISIENQYFKYTDKKCQIIVGRSNLIQKSLTKLDKIHLLNDASKLIYANKVLNSSEFINLLLLFSEVSIELLYPYNYFKEQYESITKIQRTKIPKLKLNILISGTRKIH